MQTVPSLGRAGEPDQPRSAQRALRHALSMMTARSQDELVDRTLAAAAHLTGATVAAAFRPGKPPRTHGDDAQAERLGRLDVAALRAEGAEALAGSGLGPPLIVEFGETVVVLVAPLGGSLRPGAAAVLDLVVEHARATRERLSELEQLTHRANRDPLTGLHHHRPFEERLAECRPGRTAIIALDIDRFKKINDEYGHEAGDHALVTLVEAMRSALRDHDQLYRIGGDEFAVKLEARTRAEAVAIARRDGLVANPGTASTQNA